MFHRVPAEYATAIRKCKFLTNFLLNIIYFVAFVLVIAMIDLLSLYFFR